MLQELADVGRAIKKFTDTYQYIYVHTELVLDKDEQRLVVYVRDHTYVRPDGKAEFTLTSNAHVVWAVRSYLNRYQLLELQIPVEPTHVK